MKQTLFANARSHEVRRVRSDDGLIEYAIQHVDGKLAVERVRARQGASRVEQVTLFGDWSSFERWCDADAARFEYPLVHAHLKRHAAAIFDQPQA